MIFLGSEIYCQPTFLGSRLTPKSRVISILEILNRGQYLDFVSKRYGQKQGQKRGQNNVTKTPKSPLANGFFMSQKYDQKRGQKRGQKQGPF